LDKKHKLQFIIRSVLLTVGLLSAISFAAFSVAPHTAYAEPFINCGNSEGGKAGDENSCKLHDIFSTAARIVKYLFSGAGIIAAGGIVFGGFQMVMSAGNEGLVQAGKKTVTNSLIGLIIVLLAVLMVQTLITFLGLQGGDPISKPGEFLR